MVNKHPDPSAEGQRDADGEEMRRDVKDGVKASRTNQLSLLERAMGGGNKGATFFKGIKTEDFPELRTDESSNSETPAGKIKRNTQLDN